MADKILATLMIPQLEVASDRVVHSDGQERLEYWSAFKRLFDIFPYKDVSYGNIYNRFMIGNFLIVLTRAKERENGNDLPAMDDTLPDAPLSSWKEEDWDMFDKYFQAICNSLLRKDADVLPDAPENPRIHPHRANNYAFTVKVDKIKRYIKVNKAICPIRKTLTKQMHDHSIADEEYPKIDESLVSQVWENAMNEVEQSIQDHLVLKLFKEDDMKSPDSPPSLKTMGQLRKAFQEKPFTYERLINRIELLMDQWCALIFEEPLLNAFYFVEGAEDEERTYAVQRLREARHTLRNEGQDPLEDSIRLANAVTGQSTRQTQARRTGPQTRPQNGSSLYKKRKTAVQLEFEDDEEVEGQEGMDDDDDPHWDGTRHLSRLPTRAELNNSEDGYSPARKKRRGSQQKKYEGRRRWSEEEKNAILQGVREMGKGSWASIKEKYEILFELRTSGQIKDCFRNMVKRGEVPEDLIND